MKSKGLTLIELLVVVSVVTIIAIILIDIFYRSLRGGNKAELLSKIEQNGQVALDIMEKTIRVADLIVCPVVPQGVNSSDPSTSIVILTKMGDYVRYRFNRPGMQPPSNGYLYKDTPEDGDPRQYCDFVLPLPPPSGATLLTDMDKNSGVSVNNASFQRIEKPGFKDTVIISFELSPAVGVPKVLRGQIDPVKFITTVQLR